MKIIAILVIFVKIAMGVDLSSKFQQFRLVNARVSRWDSAGEVIPHIFISTICRLNKLGVLSEEDKIMFIINLATLLPKFLCSNTSKRLVVSQRYLLTPCFHCG